MSKDPHSQLELFQGSKDSPAQTQGSANALVNFISTYEKTILLIIGFIVIGVISYCVGIEKGKHAFEGKAREEFKNTAIQNAPLTIQSAPQAVKLPQPAVVETQKIKSPELAPNERPIGYAIQVATYQSKSSAQKEAQALRKKGFNALVIQKGSYNIVCIGSFTNKEKAKATLTEIKKSYSDSYVRRL